MNRYVRSAERDVAAVADDGPEINPAEYEVLAQGVETPLEHGSGVGLWIVKWGIDEVGGSVSFAEREPRGTVVTISVPVENALSADAPSGDAGDAGRSESLTAEDLAGASR